MNKIKVTTKPVSLNPHCIELFIEILENERRSAVRIKKLNGPHVGCCADYFLHVSLHRDDLQFEFLKGAPSSGSRGRCRAAALLSC